MKLTYYYIILFCIFCWQQQSYSQIEEQETPTIEQVLSFEEYLGYVKQHHPILKQANLILNEGEASLLRARGGFDPKVDVDYDRKKFKNIEYYDQLNATFKIPTWYGVEFKANFEENTGEFLDPSLDVPIDGLYSAGVSFSALEGFLINDRMADLQKARFFLDQTKAERDLLINDLLFTSSEAYFKWIEATLEAQIFDSFLENAVIRLDAITRSVEEGDKPAIDITEARIILQDRKLSLEAALLKRRKAALKASTFLWINDIPLEIEDGVRPSLPEDEIIRQSLQLENMMDLPQVENHPKIRALGSKIEGLTVDRRLKQNKLLPTLDFEYNFLSQEFQEPNSFNTANYKAAVNFNLPIFLRKERGDVRLADIKLRDAELDRLATQLNIENKILAVQAELTSLQIQNGLIGDIVTDYETLVAAEERKFTLGESSLFLINSREKSLIEAKLKGNKLMAKQLIANAKLFNEMGIVLLNL